MPRTTVASQLAKIRKEREALEKKEKALLAKTNDKVLTKIVAMIKDAGLTADDVVKAVGSAKPAKAKAARAAGAKKSSLAGKKVAPKYRNPANPEQTWPMQAFFHGPAPIIYSSMAAGEQLRRQIMQRLAMGVLG